MTEEHIKLLQRMYVGWDHAEFGAPKIDPKRPYGNGDVQRDISEILGWQIPDEEENFLAYCDWQDRTYAIHQETLVALQIILVTRSFATGQYAQKDQYSQRSWVHAEDPEERDFVGQALAAVDAGSAGSWKTVAGYLADEVRRLRDA